MDPVIANHSTGERYHGFGISIFEAYGIQLDEHSLPELSPDTQPANDDKFPETSEYWFRAELIKVTSQSCIRGSR